jgi:hypothetical protein
MASSILSLVSGMAYGVTSLISVTIKAGTFTVPPAVRFCSVIAFTEIIAEAEHNTTQVASPEAEIATADSAFFVTFLPETVPSAGPVNEPLVNPVLLAKAAVIAAALVAGLLAPLHTYISVALFLI